MKSRSNSLEILEARIAPAAISTTPLLPDPTTKAGQAMYVSATAGLPSLVTAGEVLTTGGPDSGSYLLYVEKGTALVFFTDLNNNNQVDFNEITGISAGNGLQMVCFVDIHGDIVTNLKQVTVAAPGMAAHVVNTLTDSDNNASDDNNSLGGDGRVVLPSVIEKIEMRALAPSDVGDLDHNGVVNQADAVIHQAATTTSIFGNIYAGGGFGTSDGKNGLIIDATNATDFTAGGASDIKPTIGSIYTGSAVSGHFFSFGASNGGDSPNVGGTIIPYTAGRGVPGSSINGLHVLTTGTPSLNLNTLQAGDGGIGAPGGNVSNVTIPFDDSGGYTIQAGNGGSGATGGAGGSIANFTDLGSTTGAVKILSGDGGTGSTGAGGNGGALSFGTFNVRGDTLLQQGSGGNGFTAGGNGAGLSAGTISEAAPASGIEVGNAYGTTHAASGVNYDSNLTLGTHAAVDFDGDGQADFVFTTTGSTSLLQVELSNHGSTTVTSLPGVRDATALVVADLNNDGHPDIAVASSDLGSQEGVVTFLSRYDAQGHFLGFSDAIYSVLPQLNSGDGRVTNQSSPYFNAAYASFFGVNNTVRGAYVQSPQVISSLAAGDFQHTNNIQLALVETQYNQSDTDQNGVVNKVSKPDQVILFLTPGQVQDNLTHQMVYTGQFFADFGTKGVVSSNPALAVPPNPKMPAYNPVFGPDAGLGQSDGVPTVMIEASPQKLSQGYDSLFFGIKGATTDVVTGATLPATVKVLDYTRGIAPVVTGVYNLGSVDTDRDVNNGMTMHITPEAVMLQDFSIFDYNHDGIADLAVITSDRFLIGAKGLANGNGVQTSGGSTSPISDQAGTSFGQKVNNQGALGLLTSGSLLEVKTGSFDPGGTGTPTDDITILDNLDLKGTRITILNYNEGPMGATLDGAIKGPVNTNMGPKVADVAFDVLGNDPIASNLTGVNDFFSFNGLQIDYQHVGFAETAGSGGNSNLGRGGNGGSIGSGHLTLPASGAPLTSGDGALLVAADVNLILAGDIVLTAGHGGDGFTLGGNGGSISGVSLRYGSGNGTATTGITTDIGVGIFVVAGAGGRGVSGPGGNGGGVSHDSFETSLPQVGAITGGGDFLTFTATAIAGNGGAGNVGGVGGSVTGNGTGVFDSFSEDVSLFAGAGGDGLHGGGHGGNVSGWNSVLPPPINVVNAGSGSNILDFQAGAGGSAVAGPGGAGGSILNSSPKANSFLEGPLTLLAGDGGSGTTGGAGGSVVDFILRLNTISLLPSQLTVHGGIGGHATTGLGGAGGSIVDMLANSSGVSGNFNSVIAGDGGSSAGSAGGAGGAVVDVTTSSTQSSFALTAGAGGSGLTHGGHGGTISTVNPGQGSSVDNTKAKTLVVAGAGGTAYAFVANPLDPAPNQTEKSFGGVIGVGGDGGSILGLTQKGNIAGHFDLIAGNGGDTPNYGTVQDQKGFAGNGGSIKNIDIAGDIGNTSDSGTAIKSYNDLQVGQTLAQFIDANLRNGSVSLDDALGNVGIVVGAAGSAKSQIPNPSGKPDSVTRTASHGKLDGSLINTSARDVMSAVAGSVLDIQPIDTITNLFVPSNGVVGSMKDGEKFDLAGHALGYITDAGVYVRFAVADAQLVNGAIVYSTLNGNLQGLVFQI